MAQLFPLRFWLTIAALSAAFVYSLMPTFTSFLVDLSVLGPDEAQNIVDKATPRIIALIVSSTIVAVLLGWRVFWRIPLLGQYLSSKIFPDLNGRYEITTYSNWPIIEEMRAASLEHGRVADLNRFDEGSQSELLKTVFIGEIEQNWKHVIITFTPHDAASILEKSVSYKCTLSSDADTKEKYISYVYEQANRKVNWNTDEAQFQGAAYLQVCNDSVSDIVLSGKYWTSRSWRKGLNTAGIIEFRKV